MADQTHDERIRYLREATELEAVGGLWRVPHVLAVLDCARATLYRNRRLMARRVQRGGRGIGFRPADVRRVQDPHRKAA